LYVLYGVANVIDAELEFFANSKKRIDTCMNYTRPSLAVILEPIKKAFLDAKDRSVKLRYLTEITHDNIAACKELMTIVDELRHLDGIKGNFMVSETEYLAPVILFEKGKIAPQAVYSNLKEVVEQQQYIFDSFWIKAMDAEERIKEIEEGRVIHYETKVLKNQEEIGNKIKELLDNSNELLVCVRYGGLQLGYSRFLDLGKELMDKHRKGEHKGIRLVTTDDILDVTKIESKSLELKKERFNLNNIIINAIDDIILGKDLVNSSNVQLLYEPKDIVLEADKGRMSQVFSNLISNAIKFTKKGTITIATKIDEGNNQTIISVKDTGQGIDPEILPRLFSKFAAKSETGTGLGLFISKSIVEAHDGKIWAENNADGKGAKFSFSLPIKG